MLNAQALAAGQAPSSWPGAVPDASKVVPGSSPPLVAGSSLGGQDIPASGDTSVSSQQTSLFPRFSPEAAELYGSSAVQQQQQQQAQQQAAAQQQQQQAQALKQNLQKLYGSLGLQHGSRSSLPDIQEHEPQMRVPSDPPLAQRLPPYGRPPAARTLSDEDLFGMQDMGQQAAAAAAAHASHGGGGMQSMPPPPPAAADLSLVGQMPAGASQSRTLFVRNIDASVPDDELRTLFEAFGEVRSLFTAAKGRGFVAVSYFDTRAATLAKHTLAGQMLSGQQLDVHFSLPKDDREAAQGTLLVASLDAGSSRQELLYLFSQYGELRDVADDPLGRPNCCLVEFYDARHAAAALQGINQSPDVANRLVVMDPSAAAVMPQHGGANSASQLNTSLSHEYLSGMPTAGSGGGGGQYGGGGGGMRNVGSSPALLYGGGGSHGSSSQLDYMLSGGGALQMQQAAAAAAQQQQQGGGGGGGSYDPTAQLLSGLAGGDPLGGMNRSFSEMSLESSSAAGLGNRFASNSMSTGDLLAMTQSLQGGGGGGGGGLRGIASTGSIWPHHQQHQQHQQHHASLGSSPVGAGVWPHGLAGSSHGSLQDLLQKQAAMNAALQQQAAAALLQQQPNQLVQNAALQAAMQQALLQQQVALLGHGGGLPGGGMLGGGGGGRRGVEPPLGGRLARRPMDPMAEAERRMQQEKLYSLDLNKIRAGDDKRTTLMVKNIPNKYTQKMLLALVEERFRGMFDFFYLPIDFKNKCNVGYAFINMVRPEYIVPLVEELHGKKWPKFNSEKICHIAYGRIQGKTALVQHFQNSSLLHEDKRCRPILFHTNGSLAGEVEQFPGTLATPSIGTGGGGMPPGGVSLMAAAGLQPAAAMGQQPLSHLAGPEQGSPEAQ